MRRALCAVVGILLLAGCVSTLIPLYPATISPALFLAQTRCPDGGLPMVENCAAPVAQQVGDLMDWRRFDWPAPGTQATDSVYVSPGEYESAFSFSPYGAFNASIGDGGETYETDGHIVRITSTQDGGTSGMQYFVGQNCGGTGWVAFSQDAPTGEWATMDAELNDETSPIDCPTLDLNFAYTRWRLESVSIPFIVFGKQQTILVPTIISEHYNAVSIDKSTAMERTYFGQGWGRLVWESFSTTPPAANADIATRCPGTSWDQNNPMPANWLLSDCRYATDIEQQPGNFSVTQYGWPPAAN